MISHQYVFQAVSNLALSLIQATTGSSGSNGSGEGFGLKDMLVRMGWPARSVALVLVIMSIYSMSLMLERWLTFNAARNQSRRFAPQVANALRDRRIEQAIAISEQHKRSHLAIIVNAGLQEYLTQQAEGEAPPAIADAIRDAVERAKALKTGRAWPGPIRPCHDWIDRAIRGAARDCHWNHRCVPEYESECHLGHHRSVRRDFGGAH